MFGSNVTEKIFPRRLLAALLLSVCVCVWVRTPFDEGKLMMAQIIESNPNSMDFHKSPFGKMNAAVRRADRNLTHAQWNLITSSEWTSVARLHIMPYAISFRIEITVIAFTENFTFSLCSMYESCPKMHIYRQGMKKPSSSSRLARPQTKFCVYSIAGAIELFTLSTGPINHNR